MIHFIYRYCRNKFSPTPQQALWSISWLSRIIIFFNLTLIAGFFFLMPIDLDNGIRYAIPHHCKYHTIKDIPSQTEKDIRDISCTIKKAVHSLEKSSSSFIATFSPMVPLFALSTATCIFLFNIVINTSKYFKYVSYHITTKKELDRLTGCIRILNRNERSESILKVYFFDYRKKECQISEIPTTHRAGAEYTTLVENEPLEFSLLSSQADAARAAPNKIDIVISTTSGKIVCIRGKDYWKPKQISKV
ncbi:hypothetical protein F0Z19_4991 [Vibrio cyclitrophicus]|nr:hypothetical protein F0Z19_4991 [Vibrio cyclitrophicus]